MSGDTPTPVIPELPESPMNAASDDATTPEAAATAAAGSHQTGIPGWITPSPAGEAGHGHPSRRRGIARRVGAGVAVVALAIGVFTAGVAVDRTGLLGGPAAEVVSTAGEDFSLVREAWDLLHERYVGADDLDDRDLAYGAIEGLAGAVDDPGHTSFMTPEERERSHQSLSGSFVGVGIALDERDGSAVIVTVMRGSPAEAAGLRVGDRIVAVDGTDVGSAGIDTVASLVRGDEGTTVIMTLERSGVSELVTATMKRTKIELPAVSWAKVPGSDVVMLRLEQFSSGSADQFKTSLGEVLATDPSGIVLDLRGNGGGYINEAIAIASQFLTEGDVHLSRDAQGTLTPTAVQPGGLAPTIPLVVLVDEGTASSAEIVTGALQDAGRAEVIGRRTFGTGTVLSETPLSDGSALRIGVIEWLTPDGRSIWREGLAPDHSVTLPADTSPLVPDDLAGFNAAAIGSRDVQLTKALEVLAAEIKAASAG